MSSAQSTSERVKVLIVDDSEDQLLLLRKYFEKAGCDVSVAASADAAISTYTTWRPDLAVLDLFLPGMDGWELADRLHFDQPECVITITSVLSPDMYPKGHHALPKPVTGAQVVQTLHDLVPKWKSA